MSEPDDLHTRVRLLEVEIAQLAAAMARLRADMAAIAVERKLDLPSQWPPFAGPRGAQH